MKSLSLSKKHSRTALNKKMSNKESPEIKGSCLETSSEYERII